MRNHLAVAATVAALTLPGMGGAAPATAQPVAAPTHQAGDAARQAALKCGNPRRGVAKETITVRRSKSVRGKALRKIPKGRMTCIRSYPTKGGRYLACGWRDNYWVKVEYRGTTGWVVDTCLHEVLNA